MNRVTSEIFFIFCTDFPSFLFGIFSVFFCNMQSPRARRIRKTKKKKDEGVQERVPELPGGTCDSATGRSTLIGAKPSAGRELPSRPCKPRESLQDAWIARAVYGHCFSKSKVQSTSQIRIANGALIANVKVHAFKALCPLGRGCATGT